MTGKFALGHEAGIIPASSYNLYGAFAVKIFLLGLLLSLSLAGCETMENMNREKKLDFDVKLYGHEVRWGEIEALPAYLKPDMVETQPPVAKEPQNIRVTAYEVLVAPHFLGEDKNKASQTVRINYIFRDRQVVRSLMDEQHWEYDAEAKKWYRSNPIPAFE